MIVQRLNSQFLNNLNFKLIKLMPSKNNNNKVNWAHNGGGGWIFYLESYAREVKIKIKD